MSHHATPGTSLASYIGCTLWGSDGEKIGKIKDVYEDQTSGEAFASVSTGLFSGSSFVPLNEVTWQGEDLSIPYTKDFVKDAPRIESDTEISPAEEQQIFSYYSLDSLSSQTGGYGSYTAEEGTGFGTSQAGTVGYDTSGPTTDDAMTRSEEQLHVGTETTQAGTARLRKYVVTENVTQTVPVSREEVRIDREPITDQNIGSALDGPAISEEEHEVVLHVERPVVAKEAVPVERVRLDKDVVTDRETVSETLKREEVDADVPTPASSQESPGYADTRSGFTR